MMSFSAVAGPLLNGVETELQSMTEKGEARAIVVGLYDNGETSIASFGRVSRNDDSRPNADTVFEIGSVTKVFTVLLAEKQVRASRLAWHDTLGDRLPALEFASEDVASISLESLAGHVSGLPRLPDNMPMSDPMKPYADYERHLLHAFLSDFAPAELDKSFAYSNLGMGLLGDIAASVAGQPYGEAMQRDVLSRYGLNDTGVAIDSEDRLAQGFSGGADMQNWDGFDALAGAGALLSTTNDMLRFIDVNLQNVSSTLAAVQKRAAASDMAFGWIKQVLDDGDTILWHNGGTGGYASFLGIRPDTGTGVVILATSTEGQKVTDLGLAQISGEELAVPTQDLEPYTGSFQLAPGFVLAIYEEGGRLFGQATGQGAFPLAPSGEHEFSLAAAGVRVVFNPGKEGFESIDFHQAGTTTLAPRVVDGSGPRRFEAIETDAKTLAEFVGQYQLTPQIVITIVAQDAQLFAQLSGQGAQPVFPYEPDKFFYKVVDAQLLFERDDSGGVAAVILNQNGQQRAPRINPPD